MCKLFGLDEITFRQPQANFTISFLTFARVALAHEAPQQFGTVVTVGRLVKRLLNETVAVLIGQVVVLHGACGGRVSASALDVSAAAASKLLR